MLKFCSGLKAVAKEGPEKFCRVQARTFQAFLSLLLKEHSKTAKIINIKIVSILSSNKISLIWSQREMFDVVFVSAW